MAQKTAVVKISRGKHSPAFQLVRAKLNEASAHLAMGNPRLAMRACEFAAQEATRLADHLRQEA